MARQVCSRREWASATPLPPRPPSGSSAIPVATPCVFSSVLFLEPKPMSSQRGPGRNSCTPHPQQTHGRGHCGAEGREKSRAGLTGSEDRSSGQNGRRIFRLYQFFMYFAVYVLLNIYFGNIFFHRLLSFIFVIRDFLHSLVCWSFFRCTIDWRLPEGRAAAGCMAVSSEPGTSPAQSWRSTRICWMNKFRGKFYANIYLTVWLDKTFF